MKWKHPFWTCKYWIILITIFIFQFANAQQTYKIFLVGDAGDSDDASETLVNLNKELQKNPNSAVVFLGDNSYRDILWGLVHFGYRGFDSTKNTIGKINSQLDLLKNYKGSVFFVPGNHDWWNRDYKKGKAKLAMEQGFIEKNLKLNSTIANPDHVFLPEDGNYGPDVVDVDSQHLRIVFIDTYRVIQSGFKKNRSDSLNDNKFYHRLDSVLRDGYVQKKKLLVVAHHPVYGAGPFSRDLKHPYLFPRIKASLLAFPTYHDMSVHINAILKKYQGVYYASGHIHALQYFYTTDSIHYIVSGAGSREKILHVKNVHRYDAHAKTNEFLLWNTGGFFELEFQKGVARTLLYYNDGLEKCYID